VTSAGMSGCRRGSIRGGARSARVCVGIRGLASRQWINLGRGRRALIWNPLDKEPSNTFQRVSLDRAPSPCLER
jgi:hypothetical protein